MATFVKDNQQFKMTDAGGNLVPVTDNRTLQGLYAGTTPFSTVDQNAALNKLIASNKNAPAPAPTPAPAPAGTQPPAAQPSQMAGGDPLTKMNFAIAGMLTDAKTGQIGMNQNAQAGTQAIQSAAATADMAYDPSLAGLSPTQQGQVRSANQQPFDVANSTFQQKMQYFGKNISDMESALSSFGDMASVSINANLTPEGLQGMLAAYASGDNNVLSSAPQGIRNQFYTALAKNPDIEKQHEEALKRGVLGKTAQLPVYNDQGDIIGYTTQSAGGGGSSGSTAQFNSALSDAMSGAGIVNGIAQPGTKVNGKEVVGTNGKLNPDAALYIYHKLLGQYPAKAAQIKAQIKPYLDAKDLQTNTDLMNIFGAGQF